MEFNQHLYKSIFKIADYPINLEWSNDLSNLNSLSESFQYNNELIVIKESPLKLCLHKYVLAQDKLIKYKVLFLFI